MASPFEASCGVSVHGCAPRASYGSSGMCVVLFHHSIQLRRVALAIDDGADVAFPFADDAFPFTGCKVVVNALIEIELGHVQADDAAFENAVGEDAFLA